MEKIGTADPSSGTSPIFHSGADQILIVITRNRDRLHPGTLIGMPRNPLARTGGKRACPEFSTSSCVRKAGALIAGYRQPFDMLALAREAADEAKGGRFEKRLFQPSSNFLHVKPSWLVPRSLA